MRANGVPKPATPESSTAPVRDADVGTSSASGQGVPTPLDPAFRDLLLEHVRPAREMILTPGDPGCMPITKISGVPWWPLGVPRPRCDDGHAMSFMAQFRLSDVPGFESETDTLVSFHYCQECAYAGKMAWGTNTVEGGSGYNVSVLTGIGAKTPDGLGTVAEVVIEPRAVTLRDVMEVPGFEDTILLSPKLPADYPGGEDDLDERLYPGVAHISRSKLGGWPSWVQRLIPPEVAEGERLTFIAQLDWAISDNTTWCNGGYAYLFLISKDGQALRGELTIDTT